MLTLPTTSHDYIHIPLTAWSGDVTDPTTLPVDIALIAGNREPDTGDWKPATWVTTGNTKRARILFRDAVPTPQPHAIYTAWVRITANPEIPVMRAGYIATL